ncbi:hypothetical protein [Steroidobacter cummioxidans]|uniref:hypothetical protein n=1 Tax=Steroidobacter cummioxidans TaxID=1803913 RepID=UPI000E3221E3|nr:hypothetical protein [Steroidobacter cummioxidans]
MKMVLSILVLLAMLAGCASNRGNPPVCGGQQNSDTMRTERLVKLKSRTDAPMLYWISGHYAVLMPPDSVISLLQSWVAEDMYGPHTPTLLSWVKASIPLAEDTDLNKYVIKSTRLENLPRYIAAALLQRGDASVIDLWQLDKDKNLSDIQVLELASSGGEWRYFCEKSGEEILWVTDMIVGLQLQAPPNNRLEFARSARPTRKGGAPLLAAQPRR